MYNAEDAVVKEEKEGVKDCLSPKFGLTHPTNTSSFFSSLNPASSALCILLRFRSIGAMR